MGGGRVARGGGGELRAVLAALLLLGAGVWGPASAQELRIGLKAAVDSADPAQLYTPNRNVHLQVYEPLVAQDAQSKLLPGLAVSWRSVDPLTWELKLRPGVLFQDGSPFTAEDVMFTIRRIQVSEGLRTYRIYTRDIVAMEAPDPLTVVLRTRQPAAGLPVNLTAFGIVSARAAKDAGAEDFNGGRAAVGTGPYRWVKLTQGQSVVLERNPGWWGGTAPWARVEYRFIPNDSARVAALLAGDMDVIDTVPPNLFERIESDARTRLVTTVSSFTLYLQLDQFRDVSPFVTLGEGRRGPPNPLRDVRVRQAMSLALNRVSIARGAMEDGAVPAGQFMPPGFDGHDPGVTPRVADVARARRLLAEAGYPQGFGLTVHCTNDRYVGDAKVCQTVAQMLGAAGIRTAVETLPAAVFFRRAGNATTEPEFSAQMAIFSNLVGVGIETMNSLVFTVDATRGYGSSNRGRYSSAGLDASLSAAMAAFDPSEQERLVRAAVRQAIEDVAVIPIFHMKASWGLRRGLGLVARGDQNTFANDVRPEP